MVGLHVQHAWDGSLGALVPVVRQIGSMSYVKYMRDRFALFFKLNQIRLHSYSTFLQKSLISFAYSLRVSILLFAPSSAKSITNPNVDHGSLSLSLSLSKKNHQNVLSNIQRPYRSPQTTGNIYPTSTPKLQVNEHTIQPPSPIHFPALQPAHLLHDSHGIEPVNSPPTYPNSPSEYSH